MNLKQAKRIRQEMRMYMWDWRERVYQIIRVPSVRRGSALQARLKEGTGRHLYHTIKRNFHVQANRP